MPTCRLALILELFNGWLLADVASVFSMQQMNISASTFVYRIVPNNRLVFIRLAVVALRKPYKFSRICFGGTGSFT
jgi:hypothetical protein